MTGTENKRQKFSIDFVLREDGTIDPTSFELSVDGHKIGYMRDFELIVHSDMRGGFLYFTQDKNVLDDNLLDKTMVLAETRDEGV
jgi:pimeloyl-CoA synthetase